MVNHSSIKYISSLLDNPGTITAGDQSSIALFRQTFPYFVPVRYLSAVENNRQSPYSDAMMSEMQPYIGDWILFCDFLEAGSKASNKVLDKKKVEVSAHRGEQAQLQQAIAGQVKQVQEAEKKEQLQEAVAEQVKKEQLQEAVAGQVKKEQLQEAVAGQSIKQEQPVVASVTEQSQPRPFGAIVPNKVIVAPEEIADLQEEKKTTAPLATQTPVEQDIEVEQEIKNTIPVEEEEKEQIPVAIAAEAVAAHTEENTVSVHEEEPFSFDKMIGEEIARQSAGNGFSFPKEEPVGINEVTDDTAAAQKIESMIPAAEQEIPAPVVTNIIEAHKEENTVPVHKEEPLSFSEMIGEEVAAPVAGNGFSFPKEEPVGINEVADDDVTAPMTESTMPPAQEEEMPAPVAEETIPGQRMEDVIPAQEEAPFIDVAVAAEEVTEIDIEIDDEPVVATAAEQRDTLIFPVYTQDYFLQQGEKISEEIPTEIEDLIEKENIEEEDKSLMVVMSFSEWLLHFKSTSQKQQEEKKDQKALKTMWQKEKLAAAMEEENEEIPESVFEMAVNSITKEEDLASEPLADIYIKQGKYDQAIEMFRKLSLRNPQKSAYFARKIEEILKEKSA